MNLLVFNDDTDIFNIFRVGLFSSKLCVCGTGWNSDSWFQILLCYLFITWINHEYASKLLEKLFCSIVKVGIIILLMGRFYKD